MEALDVTAIVNKIIAGEGGCPHCVSEVARTAQNSVSSPAETVMTSHSSGVFDTVDEAVKAAHVAQAKLFDTSLDRRKKIIRSIRERLLPLTLEMAERAVNETQMGNIHDKELKNRIALENTPGVEDLNAATQVLTGDGGMTLYEYCPYGVIGAICPSTNPTETIICNSIGMIAAGNAIYFSPHPGAKKTSQWLIGLMNQIVSEASGIENLIVTVKNPSIEAAQEMMTNPGINMLVVTGGPGVVDQAMRSGKKTLGAGAGNPPTIVDETADIVKAAKDIVNGASFDNNVPCIAEKNIVAVSSIADYLIYNMQQNGAVYITDPEDIKKLEALTVTPKQSPNKSYVGRSAVKILTDANVSFSGEPRLIVVESTEKDPFAKIEMLMPIIPIIRVPDFECGLKIALELENGLHHTASMHSTNVERLNKAARLLQTSIFVKNAPTYAGIGFGAEGPTTFTIATPTGEGTTTARNFARERRCVLSGAFSIK